ncbi:MAG TPA: alkaline phosphatase family protein [Solirubrobacterales bacterium]|nr:alkaline phosphatase family protein [Solirubrobacterales bacterium]
MSEPDRREGEAREREAHPESHMRRREFLARTAGLAGLAGLATVLPAETLISQAAKVQTRAALPSPRNVPIDTFVVLMMENRSFDHYLGWRPDADGRNAGLRYPDAQGHLHPTHPLAPDFQGCGFNDPDHGFEGGRKEYNHGKLDGFLRVNDEYAIGYYVKQDLPFIPDAAKAFTLYDRYFASLLGPTFPNRHYMWGAQSGGQTTNVIPASSLGDRWETIFDRAIARGLTARYYSFDQPFAALYGPRAFSWIHPIEDYLTDAAAGTLPNIAFVDPPFLDGSGGDGLSGDEHPHGDIRIGQAYMSQITHAFLGSPQFRRGAMFINYDEWGGFFDHVGPRFVPDDRQSRKLAKTFGITGFRIPGVAISPYVRRGHVSHATLTHESILKLISYRFGLGYLNTRHRYASNIGRTFKWEHPSFDVPDLPSPAPPVTTPCSLQSGPKREARVRSAAEASEGPEIGSPQWNAYLDRLGYTPQRSSYVSVFGDTPRARELDQLAGTALAR